VNTMRIISDDDTVDGLNGNPGGVGDSQEYNQSGTLQFSAGADGGTVAWDLVNTSVDDDTAGISFSVNDDGTLILTQQQGDQAVDIAKVTLNETTGDYVYTQTANLLHVDDGKNDENNADFKLGFTVTDGDGDTADGKLTLRIDDDTPVITSQQLNLLSESFENFAPNLSGNNWTVVGEGGGTIIGNNGTEWSVNGAGIEIQSGSVGGARASDGNVHAELDAHDSNRDGGLTLTVLSTDVDLPTSEATLTFDFQPRPSDVDGSDMAVSLGGQTVNVNVDGDGNIDFGTLPDGVSATQSSGSDGWTSITLTFTGLDTSSAQTLSFEGIGSANTLGAYIDNINLNAVSSLTVDESALADGNGETGASTAASFDFSGFFTGEFGADGPAGEASESYSLSLSGEDVASGLFTVDNTDTDSGDGDGYGQGTEIVLNEVNGEIVGSAGGDNYFTISVNDDGEVTLTQLDNVWHADNTNPDDSQGMVLDAELLSLVKTITDADGDSTSATIDLGAGVFSFRDDAPTAQDDTITVNMKGNVFKDGEVKDVTANDDFGADGKGGVVGVDASGNVTGQSAAINSGVGDTITGEHGSLVLRSDGTYTYTPNNDIAPTTEGLVDTFFYTIVDGDGDFSTAKLAINIDTAPIADPVKSSASVGEVSFEYFDGNDTTIINPLLSRTLKVEGRVDRLGNGDFETTPEVAEPNGDQSTPSLGGEDNNTSEENLTFTLTSLPSYGTLYIDVDGNGTFEVAEEDNTFSTQSDFFWAFDSNGVDALDSKTITFTSESYDTTGSVKLHAYDYGFVAGDLTFQTSGVGVEADSGFQKEVPDQLGYREGQTQTIIMDFENTSTAAKIFVNNLVAGKEREIGKVEAYLDGKSVDSWTFSGFGKDAADLPVSNGSFSLPEGIVFDQLRFTGTGLAEGGKGASDSDASDYFIKSIEFKELPASEFTYSVTDQAGNESDKVIVEVSLESQTNVPSDLITSPTIDTIIAGVAAHTSGNGNTGNYANNGNGGRLKDGAMEGSSSTKGVNIDSEGYYGVEHNGNGNDNIYKIDGKEALLIQTAKPLTSITFAIKGELNGATYSLFDSDDKRIGDPAEVDSVNGRVKISSQDSPFTYIAFDGSSSDKSEFSVKPIGYETALGDQWIEGTDNDDELPGGLEDDILIEGNDTLIGGEGNDLLFGGLGADTFKWEFGDQDTANNEVAVDKVMDFNLGVFGTDSDADRLDIADLLQGEENADLDQYIFAEQDGDNTVLHIKSDGGISENGGNADQQIVLQNVQMPEGVNSSEFIQSLLENDQLKIDQ
ncbi:type I secretion C-terminal target domain-containing protein, partial [Vreelandella andesensis]